MPRGLLSGEDKVLDLVGAIYDAALDAKLWPEVLNRIAQLLATAFLTQTIFGFWFPGRYLVAALPLALPTGRSERRARYVQAAVDSSPGRSPPASPWSTTLTR